MGLTTRYVPHAANISSTASGGTTAWINQVVDATLDSGISLFEETTGSEVDRQFVAAKEINPTASLTSTDLTILSTLGVNGIAIAGVAGFTMFARQIGLEGLPGSLSSTNHIKMVCTDGLLVPVSIRGSNNGVASLQSMLHGIISVGGTNANGGSTVFTYSAGQAITAGAGSTTNVYTPSVFKYTISGGSSRLCYGIKDVAINFGIQVVKESSDSEVYPTYVAIISRMSTIEFTTADNELITEIGDGVSVSAAAQYFQQVLGGAQRVAKTTGSHVGISGTAGMIRPGSSTFRHKQTGAVAFTYTPTYASSNQLSISTTATIPTS